MQAQTRFYYVFRKFGISKRELGVVAHGLRHQRVNDDFSADAGERSPVRGRDLRFARRRVCARTCDQVARDTRGPRSPTATWAPQPSCLKRARRQHLRPTQMRPSLCAKGVPHETPNSHRSCILSLVHGCRNALDVVEVLRRGSHMLGSLPLAACR